MLSLGATGLLFGYYVGPMAWQQRSLDRISHRILAGDRFEPEILLAALSKSGPIETASLCNPVASRAVVVIRLRLLEDAIASSNRAELDGNLDSFRTATVRSLNCAPADPFLWFALYWADVAKRGFSQETLGYLRTSYRLGPFEGWIQIKRNRYSLAIFDQLPADLADQIVLEYSSLVNSGFVTEAASNLVGPGWVIRQKLLASLSNAKLRYRRELLKEIRRAGFDADVPGVEIAARPWN